MGDSYLLQRQESHRISTLGGIPLTGPIHSRAARGRSMLGGCPRIPGVAGGPPVAAPGVRLDEYLQACYIPQLINVIWRRNVTVRVVCISDTHSMHEELRIPPGDILIHAGDCSWIGKPDELISFAEWMEELPHPYKIFVAGNHDWIFTRERDRDHAKAVLMNHDVTYLQDSECVIAFREDEHDSPPSIPLRIWGAPWTPVFMDWAFMLPPPQIQEKWALIPTGDKSPHILITHGPPQGIRDKTLEGVSAGCPALLQATLKVEPLLHVFGHIHEGHGQELRGQTCFVNASICTRRYSPSNPPIVVELEYAHEAGWRRVQASSPAPRNH